MVIGLLELPGSRGFKAPVLFAFVCQFDVVFCKGDLFFLNPLFISFEPAAYTVPGMSCVCLTEKESPPKIILVP